MKTTYKISKMDCPSEERLIRMKLDGLDYVESLEFDIPNRKLAVYHSRDADDILRMLESLDLGVSLIGSETSVAPVPVGDSTRERRLLWMVLAVNLFFFFLEIVAGVVADSMGLVADSLDMLADSIVYGLALYAVGGAVSRKKNIAGVSGYFQLVLAVLGFAEVIRRFTGMESLPGFRAMIIISLLALAGNALCLFLLQKSRSKEAHMQAGMIFTSNDVIANLGVVAAGILVYLTGSRFPDLAVGLVVFILVARGAFRILKLAK